MDIVESPVMPRAIVGIRRVVSEPGELFATATPRLFEWVREHDLETTSHPMGVYFSVGDGEYDMAVAVAVVDAPGAGPEDMYIGSIGAAHAFIGTYRGPYDGLPDAWAEMMAAVGDAALSMPCWEEYRVGPETTDDTSKWETLLVQPAR